FYSKYLVGGGWAEGWGYGPLALSNISLPSLAVKTAKGIDLINDPAAPFTYPLENGEHLMHFLWPGMNLLDDRDTLHERNAPDTCPSAPSINMFTMVTGMITRWGHPLAPRFHAYARQVRGSRRASEWLDFLFWDDAAPEQAIACEPLSFFAKGLDAAAMR